MENASMYNLGGEYVELVFSLKVTYLLEMNWVQIISECPTYLIVLYFTLLKLIH